MESGILVYIPCHKDFHQALSQVERLRNDFREYLKSPNRKFQTLYIVVSVNAYQPTDHEKTVASKICDDVYYYGDALLADVNISQGFLVALRLNPEIFWLLSANDILLQGVLGHVLGEFELDQNLDLVVGNSSAPVETYIEREMHFINGVISGVIYRTHNLRKYFNVAPFFPWTGWSHLAVIQSAMQGNGGLRIKALPQESLYTQVNRGFIDTGAAYAHSFLGGLIEKFLFKSTDKARRMFLRRFVWKNFYQFHLYGRRDAKFHDTTVLVNPEHYLSWNALIAESLIKSYTPINYIFYLVLKQIPFENVKDFSYVQKLRKYL